MKKSSALKVVFTLAVFLFTAVNSYSQTSKKTPNYSRHPYWIEMMNDPKANYFETVKAYEQFWEKRKEPNEEDEIIGQSKKAEEKRFFLFRWFKSKEEREEEEVRKYKLDVKKFKHWKLRVAPYVQEDGSILDADAQLKLWEQQKQ